MTDNDNDGNNDVNDYVGGTHLSSEVWQELCVKSELTKRRAMIMMLIMIIMKTIMIM